MTQSHTPNGNEVDIKPWYREFWFWVIAAPIIAVLIMAPIAITLAVSGKDEVVKGDYEKRGRMYYQTDDGSELERREPDDLGEQLLPEK